MKRVGWIVDDPVYHQKRIWGSLGTNARLLMVRDSHAAQLREEFSKFERVETLYHGGFLPEGRVPYHKKDIALFFRERTNRCGIPRARLTRYRACSEP